MRCHIHVDGQGVRPAAHDHALDRGDIALVAAPGQGDEGFGGDEVVGGVQIHPARIRDERGDPGVGGLRTYDFRGYIDVRHNCLKPGYWLRTAAYDRGLRTRGCTIRISIDFLFREAQWTDDCNADTGHRALESVWPNLAPFHLIDQISRSGPLCDVRHTQ